MDFAYYRRFGRNSIAGESVQSILAGKVSGLVRERFPYGNAVIIETLSSQLPTWVKETLELAEGESLYVLYAHLAEFYPKEVGERVSSCQLIGAVGQSGNAGVAHLHLEVRIGKEAQTFPSMASYVADASPEERRAYLRWRTSGEFRAIDPMLVLGRGGD
ncbi:MAG: M23 family metallopeptidase [Anaerolineales bacterium]|nr:M23 family metallopeptidase [Anaerolineales bacterium]MCS7247546.1 M23 family metallopeptidase [Anaerolineales bacterium]MDW8161357.1 M23 family metallopeptidase [Anaerolineales bacterium]MDW8447086.1 M23 family metallopeptidase [Anaerolineales bacterium]